MVLLVAGLITTAALLAPAVRLAPSRAPAIQLCDRPDIKIQPETLSQIKDDLMRVDQSQLDAAGVVREQSELIVTLLDKIEALSVASSDRSKAMNDIVAPHLPLLLGTSFPLAARAVLEKGHIRTEGQRGALLALSEYVVEVQTELANSLGELEWRQAQKLRELCDAAIEGGNERLVEMAGAMKAELDTDFCK